MGVGGPAEKFLKHRPLQDECSALPHSPWPARSARGTGKDRSSAPNTQRARKCHLVVPQECGWDQVIFLEDQRCIKQKEWPTNLQSIWQVQEQQPTNSDEYTTHTRTLTVALDSQRLSKIVPYNQKRGETFSSPELSSTPEKCLWESSLGPNTYQWTSSFI